MLKSSFVLLCILTIPSLVAHTDGSSVVLKVVCMPEFGKYAKKKKNEKMKKEKSLYKPIFMGLL